MTKERIDQLLDETITRKEYYSILAEIEGVVDEIWRYIIKFSGAKLKWWAFDNDVELGHGNGSTGGEFDLNEYLDWICIIGENTLNNDSPYYDGFPTKLLYNDNWREIVEKEILKSKEDKVKQKAIDKQKREEKKKNRLWLKEQIQSKLTKEELKIIKFKL